MKNFKENLIGILAILLTVYAIRTTQYEDEIKTLREINTLQKLKISSESCTIQHLKSIIKLHENHVYRMQLIAGIKNPDSVFTYKEKVCHPINFRNLLHKPEKPKRKP